MEASPMLQCVLEGWKTLTGKRGGKPTSERVTKDSEIYTVVSRAQQTLPSCTAILNIILSVLKYKDLLVFQM